MTPAAFRRLRRDLNLHQREVAERFGVLTETVNRWEKERSPLPPMAGLALQWIAHVEGLKTDAADFDARIETTARAPNDILRDLKWVEAPGGAYHYDPIPLAPESPPIDLSPGAVNRPLAPIQPEFDKPPSAIPEALEDALQSIQDAAQIAGTHARVPLAAWSAFLAATTEYYETR